MLTRRDLAQAILLGLLYVQSCATPPPVTPGEFSDKYWGLTQPLPVPTTGPEEQQQRLLRLLRASGDVAMESETARQQTKLLNGFLSSVKLQPGRIQCFKGGCLADVTYSDVQQMVDTDRGLMTAPPAPDSPKKDRPPFFEGEGGRGRTPPRKEAEKVVATWYALTKPDDKRMQLFMENKGFSR